MQCRCRVEVYYFPFSVQRTFVLVHTLSGVLIYPTAWVSILFVYCAGFSGPNGTNEQKHRYPAFLFICIEKSENVTFRVWVFDGKKDEVIQKDENIK